MTEGNFETNSNFSSKSGATSLSLIIEVERFAAEKPRFKILKVATNNHGVTLLKNEIS